MIKGQQLEACVEGGPAGVARAPWHTLRHGSGGRSRVNAGRAQAAGGARRTFCA